VHAPEVDCITKGKVHKKYEFGVKAGLVTTNKESVVLAATALAGNPYDGNTLQTCLDQAQRTSGVAAKKDVCGQGLQRAWL
jgi:transposase, IS5 family